MMDVHTNTGLQWVGKVATVFLDGNHVPKGVTTLHKGRMQSGRRMQLGGRNSRTPTIYVHTTSAPHFNSSVILNLDELSNQFEQITAHSAVRMWEFMCDQRGNVLSRIALHRSTQMLEMQHYFLQSKFYKSYR